MILDQWDFAVGGATQSDSTEIDSKISQNSNWYGSNSKAMSGKSCVAPD